MIGLYNIFLKLGFEFTQSTAPIPEESKQGDFKLRTNLVINYYVAT